MRRINHPGQGAGHRDNSWWLFSILVVVIVFLLSYFVVIIRQATGHHAGSTRDEIPTAWSCETNGTAHLLRGPSGCDDRFRFGTALEESHAHGRESI